MAERHLAIVRERLEHYANRGVFRGYGETSGRGSKAVFSFNWLVKRPFTLEVDHEAGRLTLKNLLPGVPARSPLDQELRGFLEGRYDRKLPPHRRIERARADVSFVNRGGTLSLVWVVKRNQYAYGVSQILKLVNELFTYLDTYQQQYMWDEFEVPQE